MLLEVGRRNGHAAAREVIRRGAEDAAVVGQPFGYEARILQRADPQSRVESLGDEVLHRIAVADSGRGMEPAVMERMFEPFFTTKPAGRGTGLGLSTVHGIVADHSGAIDISSRPGDGAVFEVWLPRVGNDANVLQAG